MDNMICACCGKEITIDQYRVYCPECNADYHKDCWVKNGGCVVDGCKYNRKPVTGICAYCHTPLRKEYAYCVKCGRPTNPLMNLVTYPSGSRFYVPNTEAECAEKIVGEKCDEYMKDFYEMEVSLPGISLPSFSRVFGTYTAICISRVQLLFFFFLFLFHLQHFSRNTVS